MGLFESERIKIVRSLRHARKLKRGALSGNRFKLLIRDWQGDFATTTRQLAMIKANGIANYYGPQRFGHAGQNVNKALALFQGMKASREQRSLYLSAARSYLFNHILAARVASGHWNQALAGDTYLFDGSHSCFKIDQPDTEIVRRLAAQEIHPSGVLWGKGRAEDLPAIEQAVIAAHQELAQGLIACAVDQGRRALRVRVSDLQWHWPSDTVLALEFTLPAGSYATALLREIIGLADVDAV